MKIVAIIISILLFMPFQSFSLSHFKEGNYVPHPSIIIKGNEDFTHENGVIAGNGTKENPYIIEGWEINASAWHGIFIRNTTVHAVIRNCYIQCRMCNGH